MKFNRLLEGVLRVHQRIKCKVFNQHVWRFSTCHERDNYFDQKPYMVVCEHCAHTQRGDVWAKLHVRLLDRSLSVVPKIMEPLNSV